MTYKAIALDLDGTLTDNKKRLPEKNKEAIIKAIEKGITVILASGRPVFGVAPVAQALNLKELGGYVMACNGGVIINYATGEIYNNQTLPRQCIPDICRLSREYGVYAVTYDGNEILAENSKDEYVIKEAACNYTTIKEVANIEAHVTYDVPKFLIVGEHEKLLPIQKELLEKYGDIINAFFSEEYFLEVVPLNVNKGDTLKLLLGKIGILPDELIACGDGMNDIPMLEVAGLPVVMQNGYAEVKKYAKYIAPSNEACGVADVIEKYIF